MTDYSVAVLLKLGDQLTAPMRKVASGLIASTRGITKGIAGSGLVEQAGAMTRSLGRTAGAVSAVGDRLSGLAPVVAAVASGFSAAGLVRVASDYANVGAEVLATAKSINVGVEALQELRYAASVNKIEAGQLDSSLDRLQKTIINVATGQGDEAVSLFQRLGISARDARGNIKSAVDILPQIADAFARNQNGGMRKAMAESLGIDEALIPLLARGKQALLAYGQEARRLGIVLSEDAITAAAAYAEEQKKTTFALEGLRNTVGASLLPVLQPLIATFREWLVANRELVASRVAEAVQAIADAFKGISLTGILEGVTSFVRGASDAVNWIGGWKVAIGGLLVVMNAGLLISLAQLAQALVFSRTSIVAWIASMAWGVVVQTAGAMMNLVTALRAGYGAMASFNLVLAANPIGAVILAATALAGVAYLIYENWGSIAEWFGEKLAAVRAAFDTGLVQGLYTILREFNPALILAEALNGMIKYLFDFDLFAAGAKMIGSLADGMKSMLPDIGGILGSVKGFFGLGPDPAAAPERRSGGAGLLATAARAGVAGGPGAPGPNGGVDVNVRFERAPAGMRVDTQSRGAASTEVEVGHSFADMPAY
jgi:hypothetical protein